MKVTLIDYTGKGFPDPADYAASLLLFTKNTRLEMSPGLMQQIIGWPHEKKMHELDYMANTIPSSWEFVHLTFMVEGVTRAFTHQFVRSRTFSFAQQTMRVLDVKGWEYGTGPTIKESGRRQHLYDVTMHAIARTYDSLVESGAAIEDARGVLPTNILTNIVMSCNFRGFVELFQKRTSPRVQGEYRSVLQAMKENVLWVYPWATLFLDRTFDRAAADLDTEINELPTSDEHKTKMRKLLDQLRSKQ